MGPLGKYSQIVAAGVSVVVIGSAIMSRPLGFVDSFIDNVALIAVGAIFGSFATANGFKAPTEQAAARILELEHRVDTSIDGSAGSAERTADATERTADNTERNQP